MTNLEYLQQLGKEKALEYLDGFCAFHDDNGACGKKCPLQYWPELCAQYCSGQIDLSKWLFKEKETKTQ